MTIKVQTGLQNLDPDARHLAAKLQIIKKKINIYVTKVTMKEWMREKKEMKEGRGVKKCVNSNQARAVLEKNQNQKPSGKKWFLIYK